MASFSSQLCQSDSKREVLTSGLTDGGRGCGEMLVLWFWCLLIAGCHIALGWTHQVRNAVIVVLSA